MSMDDVRARESAWPLQGAPSESWIQSHSLLDTLRAANEQLVVTSVRAQGLADEAEASRIGAEAANRLKDEFLAQVSHELRTPLGAILACAEMLARKQLDPSQTIYAAHTIERNARMLARIIEDLLDVSRIIGGKLRIDPQPVNLAAVVQAALDEVQWVAETKAQMLIFTRGVVPDHVAGDPVRLQQVVANLLSNAVKFTPPGGRIEVRLTATDSEAEIQVVDTGRGIHPDVLPRLFEQFVQEDTSTTGPRGGLGLGLTIARALVERHGGTVQAHSAGPGQGATFTVRLPNPPAPEL